MTRKLARDWGLDTSSSSVVHTAAIPAREKMGCTPGLHSKHVLKVGGTILLILLYITSVQEPFTFY